MRNTLLVVGLALALAACATTSRTTTPHAMGAGPSGSLPARSAPASAQPNLHSHIADNAEAMLGQPYRWGGAAPGGFDCSGLVVYAAAGAGVHLPRTAAEQLRAGEPIARRELRAGDLVFMHLKHKELHVGVAIDPDRFVHAPSAGGRVRIDSLAAAPYARGFLQARRIANDLPPMP